MSVRISWRATGLVVGAGLMAFAGGPGESVAQTRAEWDQVRLSLSAAIEEVRRSPFHAGTTGAETWKGQANDTETDGTAASHLFQPGPQEGPSSARTVTLTFLAAGVSHAAAWYLFFRCGFDESNNASDAGCILGPLVPLPVVAAPVWLAGVSPDRALGVSAIGLLGGAAGFVVGSLLSSAISIDHPSLAIAASSLVHASIVIAMVR